MKISEIKGQAAIDALADLLDPMSIILTDKKVIEALRTQNRLKAMQVMLKSHPKEVVEMLAILEGEDPNTYEPSLAVLPLKLLQFFNDPEIKELFFSQEQTKDETSSSPVTENIEENPI